MKNLLLVCIFTALLLVTSIFAVLPALSSQPPMVTSAMFVGTIGQPRNVDPSQAYDTTSGELIQNVYDSMLEFGSQGTNVANKPVQTVPANDSVNVGTNVATLGATTDIPGVGYMPTVTTNPDGSSTWVFQINTNLVFQPWTTPGGTTVTGATMTWQDVVYYFQRLCVQDSHNSPEWTFFGPAFGVSNFDSFQVGAGPSLGANEVTVASLIQSFVSGYSSGGLQYVQFFFKYPAVGMWDIWCQTWSSIPPMQWSIDHGCWDGIFSSGWSSDFRRYPSDLFTPLDVHTTAHGSATGSLYSVGAEPAMCGTGPYSFTYWNQGTNEWRIDAFPGCVSHPWPGPYGTFSPAPTTVIEKGVNAWPTRRMMFLAGDFDICAVERANMGDLLDSTSNPYLPSRGVRLYYNISTLQTNAIFFTFNINAGSNWMPTVNGKSAPTFFSNLNVRWAFCQALNMSAYISGAYYGEAIHPASWWCSGLTPSGGLNTALTPWDINLDAVYSNLIAAGITSFSLTLPYNTGSTQNQIAVQDIANAFSAVNAKYGTNYVCTVTSEGSPNYWSDAANQNLPLFITAWLADFSDADDFAVPFMQTGGAFTSWQAYSNSTIDALIATEKSYAAAPYSATPGSPYQLRNLALQTLQYDYYEQAISLPTVQPLGRHWSRDWVYGYYVNQLYPGLYYQDLYKKAPSTWWDPYWDSYSQKNYGSVWSSGGNCYGLSSTEILYFMHYILGNSAYPYFPTQNPPATHTSDLNLPTNHNVLNNAALAVMIHQVYDLTMGVQNPDEKAEFAKLVAALANGTPVLLSVNNANNQLHAVVAYGVISNPGGTFSIEVSDPNVPQTRGIATYDQNKNVFSYSAARLTFTQFDVTIPGMISAFPTSWFTTGASGYIQPYPLNWWNNFLAGWVPSYRVVIASKNVTLNSNGLLDYFTSAGNSQTFVCGIPNSCGIEEGNVQVYAIPMNTGFGIHDPGSNESTILVTLVDDESGQLVGSGYFLNATTTQGFLNYTVTPSSAGLSLSTGDNGLNASVTFFSATLQDYSVSQPLNVQVDPAQTVNLTALYVTNLVPSKNIIGQGSNVPVNVTILSTAGSPQNVGLTVFANTTAIHTETIPSLPNGASTHSFVWNTSSLAYGNYTITALTRVFTNDTTIAGGNCTFQTTVSITLVGDVNGDGTVDIYDALLLANSYGSSNGQTGFNPNADIYQDNIVDILDALLLANHFNQHIPYTTLDP